MNDTTQVDFLQHPDTKQMLVSGMFYSAQLYDYEYQGGRMAVKLREMLGRPDDPFTEGYCEVLSYTVDLKFHFDSVDVPPHVRALETWWGMVVAGKPIDETYTFLTRNVHGRVIRELRSAINKATRLWTSAEEKSFLELTEDEQTDPN